VIDLHCHLLHELDDGPASIDDSLALARAALEAGVDVIVATPHVREDFPFALGEIGARARELEAALSREAIPVRVVKGAEVAISRVPALEDHDLPSLCLGDGSYMLVESPYTHATRVLEETLFGLQVQGFRPVLAHPERCPSFQEDPARLTELVERGILCSVTASSMVGRFGGTVRKFTTLLFAEGLVHNVASDAHDLVRRSIDLREGFEALDADLPGLLEQARWYTVAVPEAIINGDELPTAPQPGRPRAKGWRRFLRG
jgi:protein-tyrosine phosphatase